MTGLTYKSTGVDPTRAQDALSQVRARIAKSKRPEVIGDVGAFGGLFASPGSDMVLVATTDGVGTKLDLARMLDRHEVVGTDLVHHCVNDAMAMGAEPLFFLDYFSTSRIDPAIFARVVGAMADACAAHNCALLGGETAEMPGTYGVGAYDLAGFLVGAVRRDRILDPKNVREGDVCIGLPSNGLHTNGYTLARASIARAAAAQGKDMLAVLGAPRMDLGGGSLGDALLQPHTSYLDAFRALRDAAQVRSIAHLTGGGWEGNLPRALPEGLGAAIDRSTWQVPPLFGALAELGRVPDEEQWDVWNMGIGLVAIVPESGADAAVRAVPAAAVIGRVERARPNERRIQFS
ncbi:MAG TPA: phosphoribosylformylglycinamidine cyclo-ligase [Methylomirabilota bacterium]|nr:phosphoribosylformylglycinamidine cyclo-ligase [Methylomirabilota bacterium]